jgi:hypothetical protein
VKCTRSPRCFGIRGTVNAREFLGNAGERRGGSRRGLEERINETCRGGRTVSKKTKVRTYATHLDPLPMQCNPPLTVATLQAGVGHPAWPPSSFVTMMPCGLRTTRRDVHMRDG